METPPADLFEVEIKAPVPDDTALAARLRTLGAERLGEVHQEDTYFDHPVRDFAETDEALRLRASGDRAELTYKGPKLDEETKTRREMNVGVFDPSGAAELLEALGFEPVATVVKSRRRFSFEGATITLDEVDGIGTFCEIEELAPADEADAAQERVLALVEELGLKNLTRKSYLEMLLEKRG